MTIPFSVLDLSPIKNGELNANSALERSAVLAGHVESLGYKRFWVAEHHNMPGVASSATAVLIGYIASQTSTIRVGSGGVMLPNHAPLVIAEQFGTLESIFPNRIDLGVGRAPGADQKTLRALRRDIHSADDFPEQVKELLNYFSDSSESQPVVAVPGAGTNVPVWLLGSSTFSAQLAGFLGLPFAFAGQFAPAMAYQAFELYRRNFKPSTYLQTPHAMLGLNVIAAPTDEEALFLSTTLKQKFLNLIRGKPTNSQPPVTDFELLLGAHERIEVNRFLNLSIIGSPETIRTGIRELIRDSRVDELIIASDFFDFENRLRSYGLIAQVRESLY